MTKWGALWSLSLLARLINLSGVLSTEAKAAEIIQETDHDVIEIDSPIFRGRREGKQPMDVETGESSAVKHADSSFDSVTEKSEVDKRMVLSGEDKEIEMWLREVLREVKSWNNAFLSNMWSNSPRLDQGFLDLVKEVARTTTNIWSFVAYESLGLNDAYLTKWISGRALTQQYLKLNQRYDSHENVKKRHGIQSWSERKQWASMMVRYFTGVERFHLLPQAELTEILNKPPQVSLFQDEVFAIFEFLPSLREGNACLAFNIKHYILRRQEAQYVRAALELMNEKSWESIQFKFLRDQLEHFMNHTTVPQDFVNLFNQFIKLAEPKIWTAATNRGNDEDEPEDPNKLNNILSQEQKDNLANDLTRDLLNYIFSPTFNDGTEPTTRDISRFLLTYNMLTLTNTYLKDHFENLNASETQKSKVPPTNKKFRVDSGLGNSITVDYSYERYLLEFSLEKIKLFEETLGLLISLFYTGQIRFGIMKQKGFLRKQFPYKDLKTIPYVLRKQKEYPEFIYKYETINRHYIFSKGLNKMENMDPEKIKNFSEKIKSRIPKFIDDEMSKNILNSSIENVKYLFQRREAQKDIFHEKLNSRGIKGNNSLQESSIKFVESLDKQIKWALEKIEELEEFLKPDR